MKMEWSKLTLWMIILTATHHCCTTNIVNKIKLHEQIAHLTANQQELGWLITDFEFELNLLKTTQHRQPFYRNPSYCWDLLLLPHAGTWCITQLQHLITACNSAKNHTDWYSALEQLEQFCTVIKHPDSIFLVQLRTGKIRNPWFNWQLITATIISSMVLTGYAIYTLRIKDTPKNNNDPLPNKPTFNATTKENSPLQQNNVLPLLLINDIPLESLADKSFGTHYPDELKVWINDTLIIEGNTNGCRHVVTQLPLDTQTKNVQLKMLVKWDVAKRTFGINLSRLGFNVAQRYYGEKVIIYDISDLSGKVSVRFNSWNKDTRHARDPKEHLTKKDIMSRMHDLFDIPYAQKIDQKNDPNEEPKGFLSEPIS